MKTFKELRKSLIESKEDKDKGEEYYAKIRDRIEHPYALRNLSHTFKRFKDSVKYDLGHRHNPHVDTPADIIARKNATDAFDKKLQQKTSKKEKGSEEI